MSDFQVSVGADFREIIAGFAKLEQQARSSGDSIGRSIGAGIDATSSNITALKSQINALIQTRAKLSVDSSEFKATQQQIDQLLLKLGQANGNKLKLQVDASAIEATASRLQSTRITPADLPQATDGFRMLDGVVQGVAFSLSNAVVNSAGQALQALRGLVDGYANLDTTLRQAAGADGGAGAYDKLSSAIDKVGIDAAGTQQQVAELSLELIRGGLTADQVTQSLGGIVRGAEATATPYSRMGEIVSATLTAFGLKASETTRVVDALVQGANSSATDVSGLGEAFKTSAPAAKLLGVSVEGLTTAVGLFTNAGITAGEAGTTLRNGLSQLGQAAPQTGGGMKKLTGQAKEAADVMKLLKLDIYNANGTLKPMETVLLQLKGAFDKLGPAAQLQLASKLFGGTDDGTKWLAVLSQSEEKIKTMAKSMDGAQGATDRNRDAMQGFKLAMQQLTGTIDSLGNNVGRIAATALLPLVNAANSVVGAVAAIPAPVKDTVIALGLLVGGITAATASYVVFQRVLQLEAAKTAIVSMLDLGRAIGATLVSGTTTAAAAWPAFIAQARLASTAQFTLIGSLQATAAALKAQFLAGIAGAKAAIASLVASLQSANFATFIAGTRAAVVALAPLALAVAAISAAVVVWRETLSESNAAQGIFSDAQDKSAESARKLSEALKNLGKDAESSGSAAQQSIGFWKALLNTFSEPMGMRELAIQIEQLQAGLTKGQMSALQFYNTIKAGTSITADQAAQGKAYLQWLNDQSQIIKQLVPNLRAKADAAEREGKMGLAAQYRQQADALEVEGETTAALASAIDAKVQALGKASGLSAEQLAMTNEQIQLNKERIQTEAEINRIIAEAPLRALNQQLAVGQQLLSIAQALGQAEQSRFGINSAGLNLELQNAQDRKASEIEIQAIKDRIAANDRAALEARYQALMQEQSLQIAMLQLSQEKARQEGNLAILDQRVAILNAEQNLNEARATNDSYKIAKAEAELDLQYQILGVKRESLASLQQTQPLEREALKLQQEAAANAIRADAVSKGMAPEAGLWRQVQVMSTLKDGTILVRREWQYVAENATAIDRLNLDGKFGRLASNTQSAARAAQDFYGFLKQAAALPGARWAGGPVEAGSEYRINELGQEAFLSAGRLSLIDAAPNSIWRAPSEGVVIPAGITARLKAQTAMPVGGISSNTGVAELAIEVGKLRQEVGNLARRDWSVRVTQRTGPTGSQVLRTLLS